MKNYEIMGRFLAIGGSIFGVLSFVGVIAFGTGFVESFELLPGILLAVSVIALVGVVEVGLRLPKYLEKLEEKALEQAAEAKYYCRKEEYRECRRIADCARAVRYGMTNH